MITNVRKIIKKCRGRLVESHEAISGRWVEVEAEMTLWTVSEGRYLSHIRMRGLMAGRDSTLMSITLS